MKSIPISGIVTIIVVIKPTANTDISPSDLWERNFDGNMVFIIILGWWGAPRFCTHSGISLMSVVGEYFYL